MIPREVLKKVRRIDLRTRHIVNTILSGEYHSAFKGQGVEFTEVREYQPGDDVRRIDWNVTARMGRPFVKIFEEERELTVMLMVDASSSGEFGSAQQTKNEIAVELCAVLAFSAIKNNDRVGLIVFTDRIERFVPPKKGRRHVLRVVRELLGQLEAADGRDAAGGGNNEARAADRVAASPASSNGGWRPRPVLGGVGSLAALGAAAAYLARLGTPVGWQAWLVEGAIALGATLVAGLVAWATMRPGPAQRGRGTDISLALDFLNRVTTRRGIAFLVSDFRSSGFERVLRIARRRHDVIAVTVTDPREVRLPGAGMLALEDPETGEQVLVDSSDRRARAAFHERARALSESRVRLFRTTGVDVIDVWTDRSYVDPLVRFFTARANRF